MCYCGDRVRGRDATSVLEEYGPIESKLELQGPFDSLSTDLPDFTLGRDSTRGRGWTADVCKSKSNETLSDFSLCSLLRVCFGGKLGLSDELPQN